VTYSVLQRSMAHKLKPEDIPTAAQSVPLLFPRDRDIPFCHKFQPSINSEIIHLSSKVVALTGISLNRKKNPPVITCKGPRYGRLLASDDRIFLAGDCQVRNGIHELPFQLCQSQSVICDTNEMKNPLQRNYYEHKQMITCNNNLSSFEIRQCVNKPTAR
jgi:hypothetical protein